jgi:CheY-like chemotaxis protein
LVVEDLQDAANSMAFLLKLWGYEPVIAYDGERALEAATTVRPDVVLLDIGLPRIDGYEVARRFRQLPGMDTALLLAITGYGQEADVQRCKEAGIDRHFLKPMDPAQLRQVLTKAQEQRK